MSDNKQKGNGIDTNIVPFSKQRQKHSPPPEHPKAPLINLPDGVKILVGFILLIHVGLWGGSSFIAENLSFSVGLNWGFIPGRFSGDMDFLPYTILTPLTYTCLHSGWTHIIMNSVMLTAFGAGFEKLLGMKKMMRVFWGSSLIAAGVHFTLDPHSIIPMVGASGGISGLFGGMILILHQTGRLAPNKKIFPAIAVFVLISFIFGWMGGSNGSMIAWAAHIGGFLGGLGLTHFILRKE